MAIVQKGNKLGGAIAPPTPFGRIKANILVLKDKEIYLVLTMLYVPCTSRKFPNNRLKSKSRLVYGI